MINVSPHPTDLFSMHASVNGLAVFLDLFAIKELAKGNPDRRARFIATLDRGVEVMFCVSNAAELSGPQGPSFNKNSHISGRDRHALVSGGVRSGGLY